MKNEAFALFFIFYSPPPAPRGRCVSDDFNFRFSKKRLNPQTHEQKKLALALQATDNRNFLIFAPVMTLEHIKDMRDRVLVLGRFL
jgi:hypothetical protein